MKRTLSGGASSSRRGGVRQRISRQDEQNRLPSDSALCDLILSLFAWGTISAQLAQQLAEAAYADAAKMQAGETDLKNLKKIGENWLQGCLPKQVLRRHYEVHPLQHWHTSRDYLQPAFQNWFERLVADLFAAPYNVCSSVVTIPMHLGAPAFCRVRRVCATFGKSIDHIPQWVGIL